MTASVHPRVRDPRQFPYGLYLLESAPLGGVNGFHWFRAESEATEYLRNGIWLELEAWDHFYPGTRELFQDALRSRSDIAPDWLVPLEAAQDHLMVLWHGRFEELLEGKDPIAAGILEQYADSSEARQATTSDATPFVAFLRGVAR